MIALNAAVARQLVNEVDLIMLAFDSDPIIMLFPIIFILRGI
jgi:hypothetical protein